VEAAMEIIYLMLVVLYNLKPKDSATIKSLVDSADYLTNAKLIVWDNSKAELDTDSMAWLYDNFKSVEYIHTPENTPLSKLYNTIIRDHQGAPYSYLILFDHDTNFGPDYFIALNKAISLKTDTHLYVPIITSKGHIVSPAELYYFKGYYWKHRTTGLIRSKPKTAINSGMAISFDYLRNHFKGYDERLLFYGTDVDFVNKYAKIFNNMYVIDCEVRHKLDYNHGYNVDNILSRHKEYLRAIYLINSNSIASKLFTRLYLFMYCAKKTIRYHDIRFLKYEL
jgi:GT2 family glycosyltransferase